MGKQSGRAALYASTALVALAAHAQPAPTGGQVSAGQATITRGATTTTISQSSQNAAINWQTYNVGAGQTVQYNQPNATSFTLNRVISAQPSQIAGHILANGRIAIVNQSGVVFLQGSTVDTSGLVVSAAGIADADFMAGRLIFGAPAHAGAAVSNAGNITVRQAGLAALVAPQVRNSGTITAQLGTVILGGATTHTLDMYGDGLVALNVTGQVTHVQLGGQPVTALVTNTGTILAPGGTVVLTARAADGVVSTAVSAGGTIAAPTAGNQTGRVLVSGIGGDVEVDGAITATGANTTGGRIAVASDHHVTVAAGAVLDASGDTGGGTLAIGTTAPILAGRATIATATTVAPGATLRARAWRAGRGGRIAIASTGHTSVQGAVTAQGGDVAGDGGWVSLAGASVDFPGAITTQASHGLTGILGITGPGGGAPLYIGDACTGGKACTSYAALASAVANNTITVTNAGDVDFLFNHGAAANGITLTTQSLALTVTTTAVTGHTSDVNFDAGIGITVPFLSITSAGAINLDTSIGNTTAATGPTLLDASAGMTLSAAGAILAGPLAPNGSDKGELITPLLAITGAGSVELDAAANSIATLAGISDTASATAVSGTITLIDNASLAITAPVSATGSVSITITGSDTASGGHTLFIPANSGGQAPVPVSLAGAGITLVAAGGIDVGATANAGAGTLSFDAQGGDVTASGDLTAGVLAAHATGNVSVTAATNAFASIGTGSGTVTGLVADTGSVIADDAVSLAINRAIMAQGIVDITVSTASGTAPHTLDVAAAISAEQIALYTSGGTAATPGTVLTIGGSLTATGNADQRGTISVQAGLGDILLQSTLQAGAATAGIFDGGALLQATAGGITEAAGGAIHAGTLSAAATGDIVLAQSGNQIATLGRVGRSLFAASAGPTFSLTDGQNLDVASLASATGLLRLEIDGTAPSTLTVQNTEGGIGTLSVAGAGTIALVADHFSLDGVVSVPGGLVALDVARAGAFTVADAGGTIDETSLSDITAATLALGSQDGATHGNTTNLLIDTGTVAGPTVLDLTTVASTLALFASGVITEENPGALPLGLSGISVGTLRGAAGQAITLNSASNSIRSIAGLTSQAGSITVLDAASLDITGAISAAGTVGLTVTPLPANFADVSTLTIGADVTGSDVTLISAPASGRLASLPVPTINVQSGATVAAIGTATTPGTLTLTAAIGDLSLAGTLSARTGSLVDGTIVLTVSGGSILEQPTGALAAATLGASASLGTLAGGATTGGAIDLATGTTAPGTAPVNLVGTLTGLAAVGDIAFTDNMSLSVTGPVTATAGNVALAVDTQAGSATTSTLAIGATTIAGRSVALSTAGSATAAPGTAITLAAGSVVSTAGTPATPNDTIGTLSVTAAFGDLALNGTLTGVPDAGIPFFGAIALDAAAGAITEGSGGAIRASQFAASAQGDIALAAASGSLSGAPVGNQLATTGGAIGALSGITTQGNLTLVDGTPLTVTGAISAGTQAAIVTPALTLDAGASLSVATGGKILLAANEYTLGGTVTATDGLVAIGLLTGGTFSVVAGTASGADQIGAADLAHISAGTLALGSTDGISADGNTAAATTWTASTAGSVALLQILAPLDSAFPTLGLFSNGAILATGANSITATALYGAAATGITLDAASNQIGTLVPLAHAPATPQTTSAFDTALGNITIQDAHTLFAKGGVDALHGDTTITVTGLASAAAPNALHLDSFVGGQTITLATTGSGGSAANLPQIITFGAGSSIFAGVTLGVTAAQGDIDIAGLVQAGVGGMAQFRAPAGNIYETDAAFDTPSATTTPTGSLNVSRLAAQAGTLEGGSLYSVVLTSTGNILDFLDGFANGATSVSSATDTFAVYSNLGLAVDTGVRVEAGNSGIAGHAGLLSLSTLVGLEIDGTVQAGSLTAGAAGADSYAGSLILSTRSSDITQVAGARVLAGTLTASSAQGGVLLDTAGATDVVATLAGLNTAATDYRLADDAQVAPGLFLPGQDVSVSGSVAAGTGSLILQVSHGNLVLDPGATLTAAKSATLDADLGIIQNASAVTAATIAITAGAEVAQFQGAHLTALGSAGTAPSLAITADGGFANDVTLPNGSTITLFGMALGGMDVASSASGHGAGSIVLTAPLGDISQATPSASTTTPPPATGTILADSLAFQAGTPGSAAPTAYNAWLNSAGNSIGLLAGIAGTSSATGSILLNDIAGLTIATGIRVQAANAAALPSAIAIQDQASITIDGTLQAGALVSSGATVSAYTGALTLLADQGDITEGPAGQVLASALGVRALSGDVALGGPDNTATTLIGTSSAFGNFVLADNAQVSTGSFLPGQNVFVTGPVSAGGSLALSVTHGNLDLEPGAVLTAVTTATLAADLGVLQFAGSLTAGTIGITAGAEVFQFAGASLTATGYQTQAAPVAPSLAISAAGGFANDVTLPNGTIVSIFGITLGGTDTAGAPTSDGRTTLIAQTGDITQAAPSALTLGTLETGTLAFQAGGFESASSALSNVALAGANGIGTLSGLTFGGHAFAASSATGSIDLVDTVALTIAAAIRIEAGNTANLPSTLTIDGQAGGLSILGTLQGGTIHATDSTHGTYTGTILLHEDAGSITEGAAAALLADALTVSAPGGSVALGVAGNSVAFLVGTNLAGTNLTFQDSATLPGGLKLPMQDVTIGGPVTAGSGSLSLDVIGGNLVLAGNAPLTAATTATLAADLGIIQNPDAIAAGTVAITAGAEFAQFQGASITAGGFATTAPSIAITAGGGFANDVILSNGTTISLFGIALGGSNTASSASTPGSIRLLSPAGDITEATPGTPATTAIGQLFATTWAFQAGAPGSGTALYNAWLNNPSNRIGTITGLANLLSGATGTLSVADAIALTLAAGTTLEAANAASHPAAVTLRTVTGDLTLAGKLAATSVSLQAGAGNITQTAGSIVAGTLAAQAGPFQGAGATADSITLDSATNAIGTLATSSATGSLSLLNATGLTIAAGALVEAGNAAGLPDAITLHALAGTLSIAGTLQSGSLSAAGTYAGATTLRADAGDISETTQGRLLTNTLNANAPAGAVNLDAPANTVTSLVGTNLALTSFLLTDAATGLPAHNAFIDGSITAGPIGIAVTGGNLNLETGANLTSSGSVSLSADLGILQFAGTVTGHAIAIAAGDEFAQFAHADLIGIPTTIQGHVFASSLTIQAGTKSAQAGFANDVVLPDGHTITLNGIALGGLDTATGQGVSNISLSTPGGDISQAAPTDATTGTTTVPPAATGTLVTDILHFQAGTPSAQHTAATSNAWLNAAGNRVGALGFGTIGAARTVNFTDGEDLSLEAATTLTAGGNIRLTLPGHTLTQLGGDLLRAGGSAIIDADLFAQTTATLIAGQSVQLTGALSQTSAALTGGAFVSIGGDALQVQSALTATAGSVAIGGALNQADGTLTAGAAISITGTLNQAHGMLLAGTSATIGGDATQADSNLTATSGSVTVGGTLAQSGRSGLAAGAGVAVTGDLDQAFSLLTAGGAVTIGGALEQGAGNVTAGQGVTIGAGAYQSGSTLTAQAGGVAIAGTLTQANDGTVTASGAISIGGSATQTTSLLAAGTGITVGGGLTQSGSTLTAQTGSITVGGTLSQSSASLLDAVAGGIAVNQAASQDASTVLAAGSVSIGASLSQADASTLTATAGGVTIGGPLSQTTAVLTAGQSVTVGADTTQSAGTLTAQAGSIAIVGNLTQSAASALSAAGSVSIAQSATQSASQLTAGAGITIGTTLAQTGAQLTAAQSVTIGGAARQTGSTLTASAGGVTIGGNLDQVTSTLTAAQSVAIAGSLSQSDSTLSAGGSISIGGALAQFASSLSAGQSASIAGDATQSGSTLTAAGVSVIGSLGQTASTLVSTGDVSVGGALAQASSSLTASLPVDTIPSGSLPTGSLSVVGDLTQSASTIVTGGAISIGGDASQSAGSSISTLGLLANSAGDLMVGGSLRQAASGISVGGFLTVGASLTQYAGTLQVGTQVQQLGGQDITLSGGGSLTQANGSSITSNAGIGAALAGGFAQDATSVLHANGDVNLAASSGNIAFEGVVEAGQLNAAITFIAQNGAIVSNGGSLNARVLSARASGDILLDGATNAFDLVSAQSIGGVQLAGLQAGGTLSVHDASDLTLDHATLSGRSVTVQAPGKSITQQGGDITATAGSLTIKAGDFSQDTAGTLSALTGDIQISSPGTLSFAGLLEAPRILLGETATGTGSATQLIQDSAAPAAIDFIGGTILTESSIPIVAGAQPDVAAPITQGTYATLGLFATAVDVTQTGATHVATLGGERRQTVQIRLTGPAGTIAFDPVNSLSSGLVGADTQLLLDLRTKGLALGNIVVAGLNVYYGGTAANPLGKASLTGSVSGRTGTAAASTSFIHTSPGVNYQFNACPIQSLNCVLLSPFVVPLGSPVRDVEVSVGHRREDDDDLILPNVAEQDY